MFNMLIYIQFLDCGYTGKYNGDLGRFLRDVWGMYLGFWKDFSPK